MNGEDGYSLSKSWKPLVYTLKEEGRASLNRTFLLQNFIVVLREQNSFVCILLFFYNSQTATAFIFSFAIFF
jgi:hypothetical protein